MNEQQKLKHRNYMRAYYHLHKDKWENRVGLNAYLCKQCGQVFKGDPSEYRKFCSKVCGYKSKIGKRFSSKTEFKKREKKFKGTVSAYNSLHQWIRRHYGSPPLCMGCFITGVINTTRIEWANISGNYSKVFSDWMPLCRRCHFYYDKHNKRNGDEF